MIFIHSGVQNNVIGINEMGYIIKLMLQVEQELSMWEVYNIVFNSQNIPLACFGAVVGSTVLPPVALPAVTATLQAIAATTSDSVLFVSVNDWLLWKRTNGEI